MSTILIADDEILSRISFKMMLDKNCPHIQVIGEAENGQKACILAKSLHPDIIIMDIKMPVLNGLEASKIILNELPNTTILMLSAYNDTNYLQESINVGSKGYFLKPINVEEVSIKLNIIAKEIDDAKAKKMAPIELEKLILKPLLDKEIVRTLSLGITNTAILNYYQEFLNYEISSGYFIIVKIINFDLKTDNSINELNLLKEKIISTISYTFNFLRSGIVGNFSATCVPIFIPIPSSISWNEKFIEQESQIIGNEILKKLNKIPNTQAGIAIGTIMSNLENSQDNYEKTLKITPFLKPNEVVSITKHNLELPEILYPYAAEEHLLSAIRLRNQQQIIEQANLISDQIFNTNSNYYLLKEYALQFVVFLKRCLYELGVDIHAIDPSFSLNTILYISNISELEEISRKNINYFLETIVLQTTNKNFALKQKMLKYLETKFTKNISLESLSTHLDLSTQYVSKIFKSEFNENFIDYLTRKRIEEAKTHLEQSNNSIATISNLVGYSDQNYFCKLFKKYTGSTPKDYKKIFKNKL